MRINCFFESCRNLMSVFCHYKRNKVAMFLFMSSLVHIDSKEKSDLGVQPHKTQQLNCSSLILLDEDRPTMQASLQLSVKWGPSVYFLLWSISKGLAFSMTVILKYSIFLDCHFPLLSTTLSDHNTANSSKSFFFLIKSFTYELD